MSSSTSNGKSSDLRYERYRAIVNFLTQHAQFAAGDVREACADERPAFVAKVVRELERDGWLVREESAASDSRERKTADVTYRWNSGRGQFRPGHWLDERIYGVQIKVAPEQERPRERLLSTGVEGLTLSELLAILIRSGRPGESAVNAGQKLAKEYGERLQDLPAAARAELKHISSAVDKVAYCQIMAGIELGRRIAARSEAAVAAKITSSAQAIQYCRQKFARLAADGCQEEFHVVTLGTKNQIIDSHCVTVGTLDASLVHPREVFRPAIKDAAASVILVHNHPSGDPTPSPEDLAVTRRLESSGEILGISVLDHIVVGRLAAVSIREHRA